MKDSQSVLANFIIKIGSDLYSRIGMLILIILIARIYGVELFGSYALAFALANMLYIVSELGLHVLLIRDAAKDVKNSKQYLEKLIFVKIIACFSTVFIVFAIACILSYSELIFQLLVASTIWMVSNSFIDLINSYFTALDKLKYVLFNTLIYRSLLYVFAALAFLIKVPLLTICWLQAASSLIGFIIGTLMLTSQIGFFRIVVDKTFIFEKLKAAMPIAMSGVMISIYLRIDTLLLSKFTDESQVGLYNAAFKLYETLIFVPTVFQTVIVPKLVIYLNDNKKLSHTTVKASSFMMMISLPICVVMMVESEWIIELLYGVNYLNASTAMAVISPAVFCLFLYSVPAILLITQNRQSINAFASFWAMIINVGGNYLLIPSFGFIGSAVMVSLTQLIMLLILIHNCKSSFYNYDFFIVIFKFIIIASSLSLFLFYFDLSFKIFEFILTGIIYIILLVIFKIILISELKEYVKSIQNYIKSEN